MNDFSSEISYRTARSGGNGGQNVNKVETMAEALWPVAFSRFFTEEEKLLICTKLAKKINKDGCLAVKSSETRSQLENKQIALTKMQEMVSKSLVKPRVRKASKPSKAAVARRLDSKKRAGEKKENRRQPEADL